jgi:hypothetical protein
MTLEIPKTVIQKEHFGGGQDQDFKTACQKYRKLFSLMHFILLKYLQIL